MDALASTPRPSKREKRTDRDPSDRILNHVVDALACTIEDLEKISKKPRKSIYTALWRLKRDGLITVRPLAALRPKADEQ
jgi:hypothetical protein